MALCYVGSLIFALKIPSLDRFFRLDFLVLRPVEFSSGIVICYSVLLISSVFFKNSVFIVTKVIYAKVDCVRNPCGQFLRYVNWFEH